MAAPLWIQNLFNAIGGVVAKVANNGSAVAPDSTTTQVILDFTGASTTYTPPGGGEQFGTLHVPLGGDGGSNTVLSIRIAIGTGASQSSVTSIPSGAYVLDCMLQVDTPYSPGTTIAIGQTGTPALLQATTDNSPTVAGAYEAPQNTAWGGAPLPVLVTIAGAPGAGAGSVVVQYTTPSL